MKTRRSDITPEEKQKMQELEKEGLSRTAIALRLGCSVSVVTRQLGAVRRYRNARFMDKEAA